MVNLTPSTARLAALETDGRELLLSTEDVRYGGSRADGHVRHGRNILPYEMLVFRGQEDGHERRLALGRTVADAVAQTVARSLLLSHGDLPPSVRAGEVTFRRGRGIVPYLDELGVSHVYASPCLKARSGSSHGYAIWTMRSWTRNWAAEKIIARWSTPCTPAAMGQILDIVPNHMSTTPAENPWWNDVLENGPSFALRRLLRHRLAARQGRIAESVLLPILGDQYGQVLESGELKLEYGAGAFSFAITMPLPLDPRTYQVSARPSPGWAEGASAGRFGGPARIGEHLTALEHLPNARTTEPGRVAERQREKEVIKDRLRQLTDAAAAVAELLPRQRAGIQRQSRRAAQLRPPRQLLDAQVYRLSHWKAAADEINYRRFFDINELAAVCMEDRKSSRTATAWSFDCWPAATSTGPGRPHRRALRSAGISAAIAAGLPAALGRPKATAAEGPAADAPAGTPPPWSEWSRDFCEARR